MGTVMSDVQEEREHSRREEPPSRHAKFMRGIVTPTLGLIAVACIVFGILNDTIWRPSTDINAAANVSGNEYVITDPGVLNMVDDTVTLTVADADPATAEVCVALGSSKDAAGWVEGFPYTRVTGMSDWNTLTVQNEAATGDKKTADTDVAFADSVMWTQHVCGAGSVTLELDDATASSVAIIDLADAKSATVTMHWTRHNAPNFAIPLYFAGGLCIVAAILCASVFAMSPEKRRKMMPHRSADKKERRKREREAEVPISAAVTGTIAALKPKKRDSSKPRRRHAKHGGAPEPLDAATVPDAPKVVDPGARNLVADRAGSADVSGRNAAAASGSESQSESKIGGAASGGDETTSVITPEELAAYFARLAQESAGSDGNGGSDGRDAATETKEA